MSLWLFADCETSGFTPSTSCIWQLGVVAVARRQIIGEFESQVKPIPEFWTDKHKETPRRISGLTDRHFEWLETRAPEAEQVASMLAGFADEMRELAESELLRFTSYNVRFDRSFLEEHPYSLAQRCGGEWDRCLMEAAKQAMKLKKWPKLTDACKHYGIECEEKHRAIYDARAAAKLAIAIGYMEALPTLTMDLEFEEVPSYVQRSASDPSPWR